MTDVTNADPESIVREVWIAATPEDVFPYFTDADKLRVWKAAWAESDARPGGGFRADITGRGDVAYGSYLEIEPPRRVVFTWQWEKAGLADQYRDSVVEVTLAPDDGGTLLRPTGKSFTVNNADTCKFTSDGLICEHWGVFDVAAMMRQLGVGS
jgi:uncharacterized protein YndB with AHSA1/START domain